MRGRIYEVEVQTLATIAIGQERVGTARQERAKYRFVTGAEAATCFTVLAATGVEPEEVQR